jgi:hypothetical protein
MKLMGENSSRVLLSGLFGDQLFVSDPDFPYQAADFLREGQVLPAIRACGEWGLATKRSILPLLWQDAIRPNVPMWLRRTQTKAIIPETTQLTWYHALNCIKRSEKFLNWTRVSDSAASVSGIPS